MQEKRDPGVCPDSVEAEKKGKKGSKLFTHGRFRQGIERS